MQKPTTQQGQVPLKQPFMAAPAPGQPGMAAPAPGQPIMYQMPPGQPQPVFAQAFPGHPAMSPQGQPLQYYVPAGGQPVQQAQQVQGQGIPGQLQPGQDPEMAPIQFNKAYMKSGLGVSRCGEFICLLGAWICIVVYSNRTLSIDGRANFFRGITIFCWVMVIIYEIIYMFGLNKNKTCFGQQSNFTIISLSFHILLTILLISCTASLTVGATQFSPWFNSDYDTSTYYKKIADQHRINAILVYIALAFGYLACVSFLDDIRFLVNMFREERALEARGGTAQVVQQPGTFQQQQVTMVAQPQLLPQTTQQGKPQAIQQGTPKAPENSQL